jgi:hypothetical protein
MLVLLSSNESNQTNSVFWPQISCRGILIAVIATTLLVPPAIAKPLVAYCLSQTDQKQVKSPLLRINEPARVTVSVNSVPLQIVASGDHLLLKHGKETTPLAQIRAPQYEFKKIDALALGKDGWLWIDGYETDYMASLNIQGTIPTLGTPIALPELYIEPCSYWGRFWGVCRRSQGIYSLKLQRAFITGHPVTFLGRSNLVSFEMSQGTAKPLPTKAQGSYFVTDIPKSNGVLMRGNSGEALFYDGATVTTLLAGSPLQSAGDTLPKWHIESTSDARTFLTSVGHLGNPPFLAEIKTGPKLMPLSIPDELGKGWLSLFSLPNNSRIWGMTRHSILVEVGDSLRTVVIVSAPSFIDGPAGIMQTHNESIGFVVRNERKGSSPDYFLVHTSPKSNCKAILNPDKPILLGKM